MMLCNAFESYDVARNKDKDVDMASDMIALGCCLGNTPHCVETEPAKLLLCLQTIVGASQDLPLEPVGFAAILGIAQCFTEDHALHVSSNAVHLIRFLRPSVRRHKMS